MPLDLTKFSSVDSPAQGLDLSAFKTVEPAGTGLDLSKFRSIESAPEPMGFGEIAGSVGRDLVEPFRAIGQSVGYAGGLTGALARDVMAGNVLPSTQRPGLLPNLENVGAFIGNRPQPAQETLTPVQQGIATGVKMLPAVGLATLGQLGGIPATTSLPFLGGAESYAETGSPLQAGLAALSMAPVAKLQTKGMEAAANVMSGAIKRFTQSAVGDVEEGLARTLANSRVAQKAVETAVGNATVQAYLEAVRLPEWLSATPEKRQEMVASSATQLAGFALLQLPYFKGSTLSQTQKLISEDVPFVVSHIASSPEAVDFAVQEAFNPRNAQQFVEPRQPLPQPEGSYATPAGEISPRDLSQRERTRRLLQDEGVDRNVPPSEPQGGNIPERGDSGVESQRGQVTPQEAQTVAPILAPAPVTTIKLAPTLEQNLSAYGLTPQSTDAEITQAITGVIADAQKTLDAGGEIPAELAKELKVVEVPVVPQVLAPTQARVDANAPALPVVEPPPGKVEVIPATLKIGDPARVMSVDSVLAKTQTINGVRYELFNAEKLKDNRATIRVTDIDSGNTITLKQFPTYDAAETEFNQAVQTVAPPEPPKQAPTSAPPAVETSIQEHLPERMLGSGETTTTSSGRTTTPFPKVNTVTARGATITLKKVEEWLIQNAVDEAKSRGDDWNARIFASEKAGNLPSASKDAMNEYLFGQQPVVPRPLLKDIAAPQAPAPVQKVPRKLARAAEPAPVVQSTRKLARPSEPATETPTAQAKPFDSKQAKEQKKYLLTEIDKAIATAPDAATGMQTPELQADLVRVNLAHEGKPYGAETTAWYEQRKQDFADLFQKYNIPEEWAGHPGFKNLEGTMQNAYEGGTHGFDSRIDLLKLAISAANRALVPKIVIEIPGDGTFEIANNKSALQNFKERAKSFPTTSPKLSMPSQARTGAAGVPPLGDTTKENILKAAEAFVTEDKARFVLRNIWSDGKQTVATNGWMLILIEKGIGGTVAKPIHIDPVTGKLAKDPGTYPNWKQVIPKGNVAIFKEIDTERLANLIRQAKAMTSEKSTQIRLTRNADGSLAITSNEPSLGSYEHNIQAGGTFTVAINPDYLLDAVNAARRLGQDKISIWGNDELTPIEVRAKGMKAIIMPMRLSAAEVPGAATVPTSNIPTLVDSQGLIDRALAEGGGDAALKALVPNVRIRYGPLPTGVPAEYEGGVITLNKQVLDFIATKYPEQAQNAINKLMAEELTHAIADSKINNVQVVTSFDYAGIGAAMSKTDRQELLTERPNIGNIVNRFEQDRQLGGEYLAKVLLKENENARPIDPNSTFGQRILAALQKIWDYLTAALNRFQGRNTVIEQALKKVRQAKADVLAGKTPTFEQGDPLNAKAIKEALATFEERKAEVGPEEAARTMRVAQAGEVVAANPMVQQAISQQRALAQGPTTTPEERARRDIAVRTLSEPIIRHQLAGPVEQLAASVQLANGDLADFEQVRRDPNASDDMVGSAAGNAVETLQALDAAMIDFKSGYDKRLEESKANVKDLAESEMEAMQARDVSKQLFQQFKELGRLVVEQHADVQTKTALNQAIRGSEGSRNVLGFLKDTQVLSGLRPDDNRSINDLIGYIHDYISNHRSEYPAGTSYDSMVTENVGANMDSIRDVLNIVRLSEPLLTEIQEAKDIASGDQYKQPINKIKTRMLDAVENGNFNAAYDMFQKGLGEQGITLKQSRDLVNLFGRKTRQALINLKALQNAGQIVSDLQADPTLAKQRKEVYDWINVEDIMVGPQGTTIKFKHALPSDETVDIKWEGTTSDYESNLKKVNDLIGEYSAYIGAPDAPGYDPGRAAGMKVALAYLDYFVDPAQHPLRGHLTPGAPANFIGWLGHWVGHPELIPKYALSTMHGPMGDMLNLTGTAYSDVLERLSAIALDWRARWQTSLRSALDSHPGMREAKYRELIFDPLASSRQNYNDTRQLKAGDGIGNGYSVTAADVGYLKVEKAMLNEMYSVVNNYGKHKFSAAGMVQAGILFDKEGKVRFPFSRGEDTVPRYFPEQLKVWIPAWEQSSTEDKVRFLDANLTKLLVGYVDGVLRNDYKVPYTYRLQMKEVAREIGAEPLKSFDDLVQRITDKYNADPDNDPIDAAEVSTKILSEINAAFMRAKARVEEARTSKKSLIEIYGGDDEYNSPREQAVMPPGWYNYGVVTNADVAGSVRAGALPFANAHIHAAHGFQEGLMNQIAAFKKQARDFPNLDIKAQSAKEAQEGKRRYSWQEAEDMLEIISYYITATEDEIKNSSSPWMKDRPYQMLSNPVANAVLTSLVAPVKPVINNFMGGYTQMMGFNSVFRGMSAPAAFAATGKQIVKSTLKEVLYLMAHKGNPATRSVREMLQNSQSNAFIGNVAKWAMDIINERQHQRDYSREIGTDLNQNLSERRQAAWKFWRTRGIVSEDLPTKPRQYANLIGMLLEGYAQRLGHATVGYADARLNGMGPDMVQGFIETMKQNAIKYGDKRLPNGLYPDAALTGKKLFGGEVNHAMRVRNGIRQSGITPSIDKTMGEYYDKVMAARAAEQAQGLPPGTLSTKVEMFTPDQINQMNLWVPEDVNMPTRRSRPVFWRTKDWIKKFGWLLQWGTAWLGKLNDLSSVVNNQPFLKRFGGRIPLMVTIGILVALTAALSTTIRANFIGRVLENKVTNFPTVLDAKNPQQAAAAVIAAAADSVPIYGDLYNMMNGTGFNRGFDLNNRFLAMNLASDVLKTSKEIYQTGSLGRPLLQLASRYTFPLNMVGARVPAVSGLRDFTNARNILALGAKGTSLETKLRKTGGTGTDQTYTPSTPLINDWVNAIGNNDPEAAQKAYNALVDQKRSSGSLNPASAALSALRSRSPITSVFGSKPDPADVERLYANLPGDLAERARSTVNRFDQAIAALPRAGMTKTRTTGRSRLSGSNGGGFRLGRPRLRLRMAKLQPPRLRRLAA